MSSKGMIGAPERLSAGGASPACAFVFAVARNMCACPHTAAAISVFGQSGTCRSNGVCVDKANKALFYPIKMQIQETATCKYVMHSDIVKDETMRIL